VARLRTIGGIVTTDERIELTPEDIVGLLEQIGWARQHGGKYTNYDPLLITQDRLRAMRDGEVDELNRYDIGLLLDALRTSQNHFIQCDRERKTVLPETRQAVDALYRKLYSMHCQRQWAR